MNFNAFNFLKQSVESGYFDSPIFSIYKLLKKGEKTLTLKEADALNAKIYQVVEGVSEEKIKSFQFKPSEDELSICGKGVLLWSQLERSIGEVKYDSYGSRFLSKFPKVRSFSKKELKTLRSSLLDFYNLSQSSLSLIETEVDYMTSNLTIKNAINQYIVEKLSSGMTHCELFKTLTGCDALNHEHIDITITNATIFMTFDFDSKGLDISQHYSLREQKKVQSLFDKLEMFSDGDRAEFPAVGRWDRLEIDKSFIEALKRYIQETCEMDISTDIIRSTITTMSYLLPRKNAESFFVHDAYGHSWQESICEFEHLYRYLNELASPSPFEDLEEMLTKSTSIQTTVADIFRFVKEYYLHQIDVANNAILAEFTADAMEYHLQSKLVSEGESIPTSSKLRHFTLFLDLSLNDTIKHYRSLEKGMAREFSLERKTRLVELLLGSMSETKAKKIVNQVEEKFHLEIESFFHKESDDGLCLIERMVFAQLLMLYVPLDRKARACQPQELQQMLLILTSLFQSEPGTRFWNLDNFANNFQYCD